MFIDQQNPYNTIQQYTFPRKEALREQFHNGLLISGSLWKAFIAELFNPPINLLHD